MAVYRLASFTSPEIPACSSCAYTFKAFPPSKATGQFGVVSSDYKAAQVVLNPGQTNQKKFDVALPPSNSNYTADVSTVFKPNEAGMSFKYTGPLGYPLWTDAKLEPLGLQ